MSVRLPDHLDLIAAAPAGIQKLRGLILELAVRGKLVPQDPNDEPASELLKRIAKERARLEAEGTCKKSKPVLPVGKDQQPFWLPDGWVWIRLGQVGDWGAGATPLRSHPRYYGGSIPWFKSGELTADFISDAEEHVTELALKECSLRQNRTGDVLIAMYGATIGKTAILVKPATTNQAVCACSPNTGVFNRYLLTLLKALKPNFIGQGAGGAQPNISREKIVATVAALPPEAEQHRIVAKVDELMALCDRLEAEQADAGAAHARLVATLLGTLTQSADAAELAANWQRLAEHFDTLFTTESSLDALKQTILQLAVMGKLVPQDPNDEPVERTFPGLRALDPRLTVGADVPMQWAFCTYRSLTSLVTSGSRGWKEWYSDTGAIFIRTQNIKTDSLVLDDVAFVDLPESTEGMRTQVLKDDILITITGANVTKAARIENEIPQAFVSQHIALTRPRWSALSRWLHLCFISHGSARGTLEQLAYGAKPGLNLNNIRDLEIPIPPLAEQHRIVAKVDELMALVDRLKADLAESRAQQERLAATLIETALQAA